MVKQKSSTNYDRNMNNYKMRTNYGGSTNYSRQHPSQHNRVQVAHSNGCCSSKKTKNIPPTQRVVTQQPVVQQQPETPQQTAHDRAHLRLDPPDPFYSHQGRIKKNPNRKRKPYVPQYTRNQVHATEPITNPRQMNTNKKYQPVQPNTNRNYQPVQSTTTKNSRCCTIL